MMPLCFCPRRCSALIRLQRGRKADSGARKAELNHFGSADLSFFNNFFKGVKSFGLGWVTPTSVGTRCRLTAGLWEASYSSQRGGGGRRIIPWKKNRKNTQNTTSERASAWKINSDVRLLSLPDFSPGHHPPTHPPAQEFDKEPESRATSPPPRRRTARITVCASANAITVCPQRVYVAGTL